MRLVRKGKDPESFELSRSGPAHRELVGQLVSDILAGQSPPVPGKEAVAVWRIMEAAYQSGTEGCRVEVL